MLRVPGTARSLADAQAAGAKIDVVYSVAQAAQLAAKLDEELVFFATRLRDHRRRDGRRDPRRTAGKPLGPLRAQVHPAGDGDRRRDAGDARRGLPRRRARRDHHRLGRFRALRRAARDSGRRRRLRAARHPGRARQAARADPRPPGRGRRTCIRAASRARATSARRRSCGRCFGRWAGAGAASRTSPTATCACATSGRTSTRAGASTSTCAGSGTSAPPASRNSASAATSWRASPRPIGCTLFGKECVPGHARRRVHGLAARAPAGSGISTAGNST